MNNENKLYKLTCLISPLFNQEQLGKIVQDIKQGIINSEGSISEEISLNDVVKKRIAYPIKKYLEAFYLNINFLLPAQATSKLHQYLDSKKDIIRFLITTRQQSKIKPVKSSKKAFSSKIVEKIEPLSIKETPKETVKEKSVPEPIISESKRKAKIEELDKKLEEILNE